jgi:hypothetical protein
MYSYYSTGNDVVVYPGYWDSILGLVIRTKVDPESRRASWLV